MTWITWDRTGCESYRVIHLLFLPGAHHSMISSRERKLPSYLKTSLKWLRTFSVPSRQNSGLRLNLTSPRCFLVLVCLRVSFELAGGDFNGPFLGFWRCSAVFLRGVNKVASSASRALLGIFRKGSICARELQEHLRNLGGSWSLQLKLPQLGIPREWREKFPSPLISSAHPVCASPVAQGCPQELKFDPNWEKAANEIWFL